MITDTESAADLLRGVMIRLEPLLPAQTFEYIWRSIEAGEWKIACEDLCTQIDEFGIAIDRDLFTILGQLGKFWKLSPSTYEDLRPAD